MDWRWAAACVQRAGRGLDVSPRVQLVKYGIYWEGVGTCVGNGTGMGMKIRTLGMAIASWERELKNVFAHL